MPNRVIGNKIPDKLLQLLKKRKELAEELNSVNCEVDKYIEKLGLTNEEEYMHIYHELGCMLYTEPGGYYQSTVDFLNKHLKD